MTCDAEVDGPLRWLVPLAHTKTCHEVCVRGAHIYSIWTMSLPSVFDKVQFTHDIEVDAHKTNLNVSSIEGVFQWPFSMFDGQIRDIIRSASIDAANFYFQRVCVSY